MTRPDLTSLVVTAGAVVLGIAVTLASAINALVTLAALAIAGTTAWMRYRVRINGLHRIPTVATFHAAMLVATYRVWLIIADPLGDRMCGTSCEVARWWSRLNTLVLFAVLGTWLRAAYLHHRVNVTRRA